MLNSYKSVIKKNSTGISTGLPASVPLHSIELGVFTFVCLLLAKLNRCLVFCLTDCLICDICSHNTVLF